MKRGLFIIAVTVIGLALCCVEAYFGLLLYTWHALAKPQNAVHGYFRGVQISFWVGLLVLGMTYFQRHMIFVRSAITYLCFFFWLLCALSLSVPMDKDVYTVFSFVETFGKVLLMALVGPVLLDDLVKLRYFVRMIAFAVAPLACYYGIGGLLSGSINITGSEGSGQNNEYAAIVCAALPYLFFSGAKLNSRILRYSIACIFMGNLLAIAIAMSRGTYLALAATLPLLILRMRARFVLAVCLLLFLPLISTALLALYSEISQPGSATVQRQNNEIADKVRNVLRSVFQETETMEGKVEDDNSLAGRIHFWRVAVEMAKAHPFFGVGFRQFEAKFDEYDFLKGRYGRGRAVHNIFFLTLAETGGLGLLTFLSIFGACLLAQNRAKRIISACSDPTVRSEIYEYVFILRVSMLSLSITCSFLGFIHQPIVWLIPTISIALLRIAENEISDRRLDRMDARK